MQESGLKVVVEARAPSLLFWRIVLGFISFWLLVLLVTAAVAATAVSGAVGWAICTVAVAVGGLSAVALASVWRLLSQRVRAWQAIVDALARDGVDVQGVVIGKEERDRQDLLERFVDVQFLPDMVLEARDYSLDRMLYDLSIGTRVDVRHVRGRPELCQVVAPVAPAPR